MEIIRKCLPRAEFTDYVKTKNFGKLPPNEIVVHHTAVPTKEQWRGVSSIDAIKRYYENTKKWSAGPHLFIAEDGIWLFTDMYNVGIHAGPGNAEWLSNGKVIRGHNVPGGKLLAYSIGIEVVGSYDKEVWSGETKLNAIHAIKTLKGHLRIPDIKLTFHRDYMPKSCPGWAITKTWLMNELKDQPELIPPPQNDVAPWATEAWEWAKNEKVISEQSRPLDKVTKQELMVFLHRFKP